MLPALATNVFHSSIRGKTTTRSCPQLMANPYYHPTRNVPYTARAKYKCHAYLMFLKWQIFFPALGQPPCLAIPGGAFISEDDPYTV